VPDDELIILSKHVARITFTLNEWDTYQHLLSVIENIPILYVVPTVVSEVIRCLRFADCLKVYQSIKSPFRPRHSSSG
jgi:hypothetical protein